MTPSSEGEFPKPLLPRREKVMMRGCCSENPAGSWRPSRVGNSSLRQPTRALPDLHTLPDSSSHSPCSNLHTVPNFSSYCPSPDLHAVPDSSSCCTSPNLYALPHYCPSPDLHAVPDSSSCCTSPNLYALPHYCPGPNLHTVPNIHPISSSNSHSRSDRYVSADPNRYTNSGGPAYDR